MRAQTPLCCCSALLWRGAGARVLGWGSGELCGLAGTALAPLDTRQGEALAAVGAVPWLQDKLLFLPPGSDPTVPGGH